MARQDKHQGAGPSQRQLRVGELVRRALSDALVRDDLHDPDVEGRSITVGEVRMSPDLRIATAFVMPLGGGDTNAIIEALERNHGHLRHLVTRAVALKFSPELRFLPDTSFDQMDQTRALLDDPAVRRDIEKE